MARCGSCPQGCRDAKVPGVSARVWREGLVQGPPDHRARGQIAADTGTFTRILTIAIRGSRMTQLRFRPGDLVEVRAPEEILQTLDTDGTLDQLPFMPEMLRFCGRRFHVSQRVVMTCASGMNWPRGFKIDDVVTLDDVRCSGDAHDGCQKACMVFWREAWLRKLQNAVTPLKADLAGVERLRARLKTLTERKTYFCQASELGKIT